MMRSFEKWFAEQGVKPSTEPQMEQEYPDGVWKKDGKWIAECRVCGCAYELPIDPVEDGFDQDMSYCGGSPRCCP